MPGAELQQVEGAIQVYAGVKLRLFDRGAHPRPGCQMDNQIKLETVKDILQRGAVGDIRLDQGEGGVFQAGGEVPPFGLRRVKITEVVQADDSVSPSQQRFAEVGANESGASRDQDQLRHSRG